MKLAAISGVNGPFTDADIRRVRKLALVARAKCQAAVPRGKSGIKQAARRRSRSRPVA
jgi:hypothetical protein